MKSVAIGVHLRREHVEEPAEAVMVGELFLSAMSVADDAPLSDRDLLIHVATVRARLLDRATFIAVRYGFTFRSPAEALAKCATRLDQWKHLLVEHQGRVEMTLRVAAAGPARPQRAAFANGADYLKALHTSSRAASVNDEFRAAVDDLIVPLCIDHRWSPRDEKSVELAGLIDREDLASLDGSGRKLRERCPSIPFLLSAPWPLEVFADADYE